MSQQKITSSNNYILQIINHKIQSNSYLYLVKWFSGTNSWECQSNIPNHILQSYNHQINTVFNNNNLINQIQIISQQSNYKTPKQKSHSNKKSKRKSKKKQKKTQKKPNKNTKPYIKQQQDSFMNDEIPHQQQHLQENHKKQNSSHKIFSSINNQNHDVELIAQIQSSNNQQQNDSQCQQQSIILRRKQITQSKIKKPKQKTKMINKDRNLRFKKKLNYNYINDYDDKQKNNKLKSDSKNNNKNKINLQTLNRDFNKPQYIQNLLIYSVLESGMCGPYKYYLVRLKNNDNVYIRQKYMRLYFPRKLHQFYQRILNKVAKPTRPLNFAL